MDKKKKSFLDEISLSEFRESLNDLKDNHRFITSSVLSKYSEIDKNELLVASGAFVLLINYLTFFNDTQDAICLPCLILGVVLLVVMIIVKFFVLRHGAHRAEQEKEFINNNISIVTRRYGLYIKRRILEESLETDSLNENQKKELIAKLQDVIRDTSVLEERSEDNLQEFHEFKSKLKNMKWLFICLNWAEFILFVFGIFAVLTFFIVNII